MQQRYDALLIDVNNFAYTVFDHKAEKPATVSKKQVYKKAVCNFIEAVTELKKKYLHSADGKVYLLFDNPTSRIDLQSTFYFADRKQAYAKYKADRAKQPKEFYNSLNLLKYYYMVQESCYHTVQVSRLEADDLVEPVLRLYCQDKRVLMVTNDLDWARYINHNVHWLPKLSKEPEGAEHIEERLGFRLTEQTLVMYKALFGDPADNIPSVAPGSMKEQFVSLLEEVLSADQLPRLACSDDNIGRFPILEKVRTNERQYRINLQLVNSIPVADKHIEAVITTGRNSEPAIQAVHTALGITTKDQSFVFGNIRRPRVC